MTMAATYVQECLNFGLPSRVRLLHVLDSGLVYPFAWILEMFLCILRDSDKCDDINVSSAGDWVDCDVL